MADFREDTRAQGREELSRIIGGFRSIAGDVVGNVAHAVSPEGRRMARRRQQARNARAMRTFRKIVLATAAIFIAVLAIGFVTPIGLFGVLAAAVAMILAWAAIIAWNGREAEVPPERFVAQTDLAQLPARTDAWLERQRPALPAPAQRQLDQISLGLEQLGPQLAGLDTREPAAVEVRRLIGEELPELVRGYARVPDHLRRQPLNGGLTPDRQLAEGLATIGEELGRMNAQLATGDLHALATQQRYLELKYKGDGVGDDGPPALSPPPGKAS